MGAGTKTGCQANSMAASNRQHRQQPQINPRMCPIGDAAAGRAQIDDGRIEQNCDPEPHPH